MSFSKMIELLQKKNKGSIVIINSGAFYIARGKDAVLLNQEIGLKTNCMETEICKVGFPLNSIEKYTKLIKEKGYSYIVYNYNRKEEQLNILKEYKHGGYTVFYITEPKVRKIEKSKYIDRIVHRWLVDNYLIPTFIPQLVNTTYACIKDRGMHKACLDLQKAMLKMQIKYKNYYILKMDVAKYFDNIDKYILLNILEKKIKDKDILWLINQILFTQTREKGLEIGNYTSQTFANIYLNEVDQFIKHKLHIKYYFRFMDDSVILVENKKKAQDCLEKIKEFLKENLKLELNSKTQIFKSKQGVNFCGYKINEYRLKIRDKGKRKLKKKIKELKYKIRTGQITSKESHKYLAGHLGYIKIANTRNLEARSFYME